MEELNNPTVRMKNRLVVEEKINSLIKGGSQRLQVISDFDFTLSRSHLDGKRCSSCHDAIDLNERMPKAFREKVRKYKEHYYPMVSDPGVPSEEKIPYMVEWWNKWHEALLEAGLKKSDLMEMVNESSIMLRDDCLEFLDILHRHKVPLVIFSAGIGDVLEEAIRQQACMFDNIKVISNYMNFGEDGHLTGLRNGTIIHIFNKNSNAVDVGDSFGNSADRPNILLLGDSIGDVNMDAGLANRETILRIGFLNADIEANLNRYKENYDVVILNDQSMSVVNSILQKVLH